MSIKVEKFVHESEETAKMTGKKITITSDRCKLTNETTGDTYTINTATYDKLSAEGKSDAQIFGYIDDIMRD